jgi:hypothetical protein
VSGLTSKPLGWFLIGLGLKTDGTVYEWFDLKTTRMVSSGLTSKYAVTVSSGLASKLAATDSSDLASKPALTVFASLASKLMKTVFLGLTSKPAVGFLVEPQNQGGGGFPGLGLQTGSSGLVICASKTP